MVTWSVAGGGTIDSAGVFTAGDDVGVMRLELLVDGAVTQMSSGTSWRPRLDPGPLAAGPHTVRARAIDTAGQSAESASIGFTVVRGETPPKRPEVIRGSCGCTSGGLVPLLALALGALSRRRRRE
jgi:uncharacterized protein (TIGR03382 family)